MANPVFDRSRALGDKITKMDKQELCEFISALCRQVVSEVGSRGRRGGIYPENISVDEHGAIAIGSAGKSPWDGQELQFVAPELYWNGHLSAASDVYSVGMLLYYGVNDGKLPLEGECENPQLRRMGGDDFKAPRQAGRRLGEIIEKAISFKAGNRYQTLEELRAVLDSCIKNLYLNGAPSSEVLFNKKDDDLNDIERMMVGIIENSGEDGAGEAVPEIDGENVKLYKPTNKDDEKQNSGAKGQAAAANRSRKPQPQNAAAPVKPVSGGEDELELKPVLPSKPAPKKPPVQYVRSAERERRIAEEVKKRRRRPLAVILVLCAILIMVAIVLNAILKDYQEQSKVPEVVSTVDPFAAAIVSPIVSVETPEPTVDPFVAVPDTPEPTPAEHGYKVVKADCSWTEAQQACISMGGHLVVIDDRDEYNEIVAMAEAEGVTRVWIGCHRVNGQMIWEKETEGFIVWAKGEPTFVDTNDKVAEDYIMLWNNNGWACNDNRDDPCKDYPQFYSGTMGYICEFGD